MPNIHLHSENGLHSRYRSLLHQEWNHEEHLKIPGSHMGVSLISQTPGVIQGVDGGEIVQRERSLFVELPPVGEGHGAVEDDGGDSKPASSRRPGVRRQERRWHL